MGFFEEIEKVAGAVVAVEALKKVDSDPSLLSEGAAAVAGFEGVGALEEHFDKKEENNG